MMRAPRRPRSPDDSALTLACVPTGMKTGVSIGPCAVCSTPARAVAVARDDLEAPAARAAHAPGLPVISIASP